MEVTARQLGTEPEKFISQAASGQEITVTYRGRPCAKIVPIASGKDFAPDETEDELFGLWRNRLDTENVEQFARDLRKGRNP